MTRLIKKIWIIPVCIYCLFVLTACYIEEKVETIDVPSKEFSFDSENIIRAIANGNDNPFTPLVDSSKFVESDFIPQNWSQAEFLIVANSLHKVVWNETLEEWSLNLIDLSMDCEEVPYGFQSARLIFFKVIRVGEGQRISHTIYIDLKRSLAAVSATKYTHLNNTWNEVHLQKMSITANEAFQLVEENGGEELRNSLNNECTTSTTINASIPDDGYWHINYYGAASIFQIRVDIETGRIIE